MDTVASGCQCGFGVWQSGNETMLEQADFVFWFVLY